MIEQEYKEVAFNKYCATCKHKEASEADDVCNECLENPVNLYSEKPVNYEEK